MCGRYTVGDPKRCIAEFSVIEKQPALEPRFNIAPSQGVWVIRKLEPGGDRRLDLLRWGFVVPESKRPSGVVMARAESVASRAPFTSAFRSRRCLFLADGFYEWKRTSKQSFPYFIHRPGNAPFAMAAVWEPAVHEAGKSPLDSCAIITRPARPPVAQLHDRMPVLLSPEHHEDWLDPSFSDVGALRAMLLEEPKIDLVAEAVGPRVNSPANDDPTCVVPIAEGDRHGEQIEMWPR
jgi:putative SOS response-associated peptidase YedK